MHRRDKHGVKPKVQYKTSFSRITETMHHIFGKDAENIVRGQTQPPELGIMFGDAAFSDRKGRKKTAVMLSAAPKALMER